MDEAEPLSMTVYPKPDGSWWVRLAYASGEVEDKGPMGWNGEGGFYLKGLDFVRRWIPKGYAYQGSGSWQDMEDGSYVAVLYRRDPRFG